MSDERFKSFLGAYLNSNDSKEELNKRFKNNVKIFEGMLRSSPEKVMLDVVDVCEPYIYRNVLLIVNLKIY